MTTLISHRICVINACSGLKGWVGLSVFQEDLNRSFIYRKAVVNRHVSICIWLPLNPSRSKDKMEKVCVLFSVFFRHKSERPEVVRCMQTHIRLHPPAHRPNGSVKLWEGKPEWTQMSQKWHPYRSALIQQGIYSWIPCWLEWTGPVWKGPYSAWSANL